MKNRFLGFTAFFSLFLLLNYSLHCQDTYIRNDSADVKSYIFNLELSDENDEIKGTTEILVEFKGDAKPFSLDLIEKSREFGMEVTEVLEGDKNVNYTFENNKIRILPSQNSHDY